MLTRQHPLTDAEKRYLKRSKGIKTPFSLDKPQPEIKKVRAFNAPMVIGFVPRVRGRTGCRLSHEKRLLILERHEKRVAFFASLGVSV